MKRVTCLICIAFIFLVKTPAAFAIEYPIISLGINGGWGQNQLSRAGLGRIFLRYSLEAYLPGFQLEIGYTSGFYRVLSDSTILNPEQDTEKRQIQTNMFNHYPAISGAFHLRPFGESTVIYFGGGAQIHFLTVETKVTDRYWDTEAEKYQELTVEKTTLLDQTKIGYHLIGGMRFLLGGFGSLDLEMRQTFLNVVVKDWDDVVARVKWGDKSWNDFSVNVGLTIYIF